VLPQSKCTLLLPNIRQMLFIHVITEASLHVRTLLHGLKPLRHVSEEVFPREKDVV